MNQHEIEKELRKRDKREVKRVISPLKKAIDSYELDTTYLSPKEVVEKILDYINIAVYEEEKNCEK